MKPILNTEMQGLNGGRFIDGMCEGFTAAEGALVVTGGAHALGWLALSATVATGLAGGIVVVGAAALATCAASKWL